MSSRSICRVPLSVGRRRRKEEGGGSASSEAHLGRGVSSVGRAAFALVTSVERDAPHAMGLEHESIVVCRYMYQYVPQGSPPGPLRTAHAQDNTADATYPHEAYDSRGGTVRRHHSDTPGLGLRLRVFGSARPREEELAHPVAHFTSLQDPILLHGAPNPNRFCRVFQGESQRQHQRRR